MDGFVPTISLSIRDDTWYINDVISEMVSQIDIGKTFLMSKTRSKKSPRLEDGNSTKLKEPQKIVG